MNLNITPEYLDKIDKEKVFKAYLRFKFSQLLNQKKTKFGSSLSVSDLTFPSHCPILGIELDYFNEVMADNSPSLDRVDPDGGYVPGNVLIVSMKANRIKMNGTLDEIVKIAEYIKKHNSKGLL
jgi:hypothetical protein